MRVVAIGLALTVALTLVATTVVNGQLGRILPGARCLHDDSENQTDRVRRDQALALARAINAAQGRAIEQSGRYESLSQLPNLPPAPDRFSVQLQANEDGYIFSIKDTRDPCRFGIFSDQQGTIYQQSPTLPLIAS